MFENIILIRQTEILIIFARNLEIYICKKNSNFDGIPFFKNLVPSRPVFQKSRPVPSRPASRPGIPRDIPSRGQLCTGRRQPVLPAASRRSIAYIHFIGEISYHPPEFGRMISKLVVDISAYSTRRRAVIHSYVEKNVIYNGLM